MKKLIALFAVFQLFHFEPAFAANTGDEVFVVYNTRVPESKEVAEHYAAVRKVPKNQVLGLDMADREVIRRDEFRKEIQRPICNALESRKLWHFEIENVPASDGLPRRKLRQLTRSGIRYLVLCYGVPLTIQNDPGLHELLAEKMPPQLAKNTAAVDSELACLPLIDHDMLLAGPLGNKFAGCTNASLLNPTNGILLVTRLDGPTGAIARALVDKAVEAETNGLWGRAYFDLRGLTNGEYKMGDDWIRQAAQAAKNTGYETVVDYQGGTFPSWFPLSQVALYAGWYDENVSGPFARPKVEFMPGAFAYHLHSFSAATIRSTRRQWVGPFLDRGVTATMGCVDEPFLGGTPEIGTFFERFLYFGFSFGEAAYAAQTCLSWQTTIVGDPLYSPFKIPAAERHRELESRRSKWLEWSYLRLVNLKLLHKVPTAEVTLLLEELPLTKTSPVLEEKLAELYAADDKTSFAQNALRTALKLDPSPQQRTRITLLLADRLAASGNNAEAYDLLDKLLAWYPDYPNPTPVLDQLGDLARKLGRPADAEHFARKRAELLPKNP